MVIIAPSILSADFSKLKEEIRAIEPHAGYIHVDVMDGHFVPNITFGPAVVKSLRKTTMHVLDVHLMITDPKKYVPEFFEAGADIVTVHVEACSLTLFKKLSILAHKKKRKIGITLRPRTAIKKVLPYLKYADLVLVMSVEPGFGGQSYIKKSSKRIAALRKEVDRLDHEVLIEVDGGINKETAKEAIQAGVDILVAGSYVFKSNNYEKAITSLRKAWRQSDEYKR